ncbi:unnamed protein product, partial [Urochloa humidicola]
AQAAHSLPVSSPTLSQIQTLSHGRNSLHCISAAEQPALPLHGSPPLTLPLRRRSCLSLLFCPLSRLMDSRPVQVHGVAGEAQTRCGIFVPSPSRRQRAPPSLVGRHRAPHQATTSKHQIWTWRCAILSSCIHTFVEHSVHQTMSSNLGLQAMIAPPVASRCLPCQERLSVDIFYLKVWRSRNVSFSGGFRSRKSV